MPLAGITDTEVYLTVCFVTMFAIGCNIDIYAYRSKTDSQEKIICMHLTQPCSIPSSGPQAISALKLPQSVAGTFR